nr:trypsin-like peptidase domain-containing protein [Pyrinomonadaceae bacterium]
ASFVEIARRVEPAVVNIDTVSQSEIGSDSEDEDGDSSSNNTSPGNPLMDMFRQQMQQRMRRPSRGVGSGFIVDPKGFILTNQHVVEGATRITVKLQTGEQLRGRVVGMDEETDVAVVKVDAARDLPSVRIGNSDDSQVGDWVLAIGSPFGLEQTVTAGIISTKQRQTRGASSFQRFLQTDAAINRGNSGGPLVNMHGEVIGINSQIATTTGDYNGIGFALPANEAAFVYRQITANGKVRRGYLGINLAPVKAEYARVYGLPEAKGAVVTDFPDAQTPAEKAGIQRNDVIVEFNGQSITSPDDLIGKVAATPIGQTVQLTYLRDTANNKFDRLTASVVIGERPARQALASTNMKQNAPDLPTTKPSGAQSARPRLGLTLNELTPQIAAERKLTGVRGLLVKDVDPGSLADDAGIEPGRVIQRFNRTPVATLADFERVISSLKPGDAIVMSIAEYDGQKIVQTIVQFTYQ